MHSESKIKSYPSSGRSFPIPVIACVIFRDYFDPKLAEQAKTLLRHMTGEKKFTEVTEYRAKIFCALVLNERMGTQMQKKRTQFNKMKAGIRIANTKNLREQAYKILIGSGQKTKHIHKLAGADPHEWAKLRDG
jgi:hypothetical protein